MTGKDKDVFVVVLKHQDQSILNYFIVEYLRYKKICQLPYLKFKKL